MNITRLEHAGQILERDGAKVIVDPGMFTAFDDVPTDVAAVVITHEHRDHWLPENVRAIGEANPEAVIVGTQAIADAAPDLDVRVVLPGDTVDAAPFQLEFFGGTHAEIHSSIPLIDNVGVLVNGTWFYGGDSLEVPGVQVHTLAVPASAPWMKMGEMIDFVLAVAPERTYPVHDLVHSDFGNSMANARIDWAVQQSGGTHFAIDAGEQVP